MEGPYPEDAPWPCMRGDPRSLGRARAIPVRGAVPVRAFPTGGPVFGTPVIGPGEQIFVGSADRAFYCFDPHTGRERWRFETGEVIDSAACLDREGRVWVPGGDGRLYALCRETGRELWRWDRLVDGDRYTPSTIFWFEGNATLGPGGDVFAGNDDFHLYAFDPGRGVRWAQLTGLHIWSAPAFDSARVVVASFDGCLYAFDLRTGARLWRTWVGNFVASSPAIDGGRVYVGSFDGSVIALGVDDGAPRWRRQLGGPVYASVAVGPSALFVGAADGFLHALAPDTGEVLWSRWLGDPVRGSAASIGDRVVVPGGDGRLFCFTATGERVWAYDTAAAEPSGRASNLNASVAVGRHGVATASATGTVHYLPWDPPASTPGLELGEAVVEGDGPVLVAIGPGDLGARSPRFGPRDTVGVRVIHRGGGRAVPGAILEARATSGRAFLSPDGSRVDLEGPEPGFSVDLRYRAEGAEHRASGSPAVEWLAPRAGPLPGTFRIARMALPVPSIVPSFDQIGLASLHIDVGLVKAEGESLVAWGVQRFGLDPAGSAVGVPAARTLFYPFAGTWREGTLVLEARDVWFEITALPVPLDRLVFVAHHDGERLRAGSLVASLDTAGLWRRLPVGVLRGRLAPRGPSEVRALARVVRRWIPLGIALARGDLVRPWGLLDGHGRFQGSGSFEIGSAPEVASALRLIHFDRRGPEVVARWAGTPGPQDALALCFVDPSPRPVGSARDLRISGTTVLARIPPGAAEVWAMQGLARVGRLVLA